MFVKLGTKTICDSEADGVTYLVDFGLPEVELLTEELDVVGVPNLKISRGIESVKIAITVSREFKTSAEKSSWAHAHLRSLGKLERANLFMKDMLGNCFGYGDATLDDFEIVSQFGVGLEIAYNFSATAIIDKILPTVAGKGISIGGKLLTLNIENL